MESTHSEFETTERQEPSVLRPEAGRYVVRKVTRTFESMQDVITMSASDRRELDADLANIRVAEQVGLETGSLHIIGRRS